MTYRWEVFSSRACLGVITWDNRGMLFRTPEKVKQLRSLLGMNQDAFAAAIGVSLTTAGRWDREGISSAAPQENLDRYLELEAALPPSEIDSRADEIMRGRIAGALPDLPHNDLADLLADVKRRQLAALRAEFELGAEADARAAHAAAQAPDGNGKRSRANGG